MSVKARVETLQFVLNEPVIDIDALKTVCFKGIPDESRLRPLCWRLLLNYLPTDKLKWPAYLHQQRRVYDSLIQDLLVKADQDKPKRGESNGNTDHPLNPNPQSVWTTYFKDNEIVAQINKDVRRLCPEISFFQQATEFPSKILMDGKVETLTQRVNNVLLEAEVLTKNRSGGTNLVSSRKVAAEQYEFLGEGREAHWQVVERILFIYAKLNPGVKYVQGMNEVLGPIYYVFASDSNAEWREFAEVDAFYCFQNLMSEICDNFLRTMDDSLCGIEFKMNQFYDLLRAKDPEVHNLLAEVQELLPQYYAFRWLSLLLSQEFLLPDVIRIWDSLFADTDRFNFLFYVCLSMLVNVRDQILANDFSTNMRLLQNYPNTDIDKILVGAAQLRSGMDIKSISQQQNAYNS